MSQRGELTIGQLIARAATRRDAGQRRLHHLHRHRHSRHGMGRRGPNVKHVRPAQAPIATRHCFTPTHIPAFLLCPVDARRGQRPSAAGAAARACDRRQSTARRPSARATGFAQASPHQFDALVHIDVTRAVEAARTRRRVGTQRTARDYPDRPLTTVRGSHGVLRRHARLGARRRVRDPRRA